MTTSGPAAPRHLHCLDPPLHRTEVKRKSEVNFRETVVTFKSNGNVTTGLSEEQTSQFRLADTILIFVCEADLEVLMLFVSQ